MNYVAYQQALSMPQSKGDISARLIVTSTVKYAVGLMIRLIEQYKAQGLAVYEWCVWEVVKPLPVDNPKLMARIQQHFGNELPPRINEAEGYYDWEDLIARKLDLDDEVWGVEWVCNQPERSGLVYSPFDLETNTINEDNPWPDYRQPYTPNLFRPIYILEDFGYGPDNPNVNLFCQVVGDTLVVFDELYNYGKVSRENMELCYQKLEADYGIAVERHVQADGRMIYRTRQDIQFICDPAGLTEMQERRQAGLSVAEPLLDRVYYQLKNRIPLVRRKIADRTIQIAPNGVNLIEEMQSYRLTKNRDGQYTDVPEKKNDHGPDALGYGSLILFSVLAQAQNEDVKALPNTKPLTAGLRNRTF